MTGATPYDEIAYPTIAFRQTHPDRLAAHAMLFGLPFAPLDRFRFLDIGGGDSANLIPMAVTFPNARFVGFDISRAAVARGQAVVQALGLTNIEILHADIAEADFGEHAFDYIVAHGVYSWVPDGVRDALMALIGRALAPHGVAFVSYNAFPGARMRQMIRDMLLHHLRDVTGVAERVEAGRAYLRRVLDDYPETDALQAALKVEVRELLSRPASVMAHDELGDVYHPVHLHEFQADALAHGLRFLTEAEGRRAGEGFAPPHALDDPGFDVLAHAQELDFRIQRPFRQSLLVRADVAIDRRPRPERVLAMHASSSAVREGEDGFIVGPSQYQVADAQLAAAMERLGAAWPGTLPIADLIEGEERAGALLRMYWAGALDIHPAAAPFSTTVSERPEASPLARFQAASGAEHMINLRHGVVAVPDPFSRDFIAGLDGRRTHEELARDVTARLGRPLDDGVRRQVETNLEALARMPLLIA